MRTGTKAGFAIAIAAALALACSESRQEKFEKAMRAAEVAQTSVESAQREYTAREIAAESAREAAVEAESELATARQQLDAATATFDSARTEVAKWADDASVSRILQQRLLEESALEHAAVAARVENGVALLDGTAPDPSAAQRAVEIARETPGVVDVQSQLVVPTAPEAAPAVEPPAEAIAPMEAAPPPEPPAH